MSPRTCFWLLPLAFVTLWVWLEVVRAWLWHRLADDLRARHRRLHTRALTPPCAFCHSTAHTYLEHVRIPQADLAIRDADPELLMFGEW